MNKGQKWTSTDRHWTKGPNAQAIHTVISEKRKHIPGTFSGKSHSLKTREQISATKKTRTTTIRGEKHHNWKGGVVSEHQKARGSLAYVNWRDAVYARDNWTCQTCGIKCKKGNIVAHHIQEFADVLDLRYDVSNGLTLCRACHVIHHLSNKASASLAITLA